MKRTNYERSTWAQCSPSTPAIFLVLTFLFSACFTPHTYHNTLPMPNTHSNVNGIPQTNLGTTTQRILHRTATPRSSCRAPHAVPSPQLFNTTTRTSHERTLRKASAGIYAEAWLTVTLTSLVCRLTLGPNAVIITKS